MAESGNKYGAVIPLVKDTAWWQRTDITLYNGEIAWELKAEGGSIETAYMLRGDGKAVNPNHTRLRVSGDNIMVTFNGGLKTINTALAEMNTLYSDADNKYAEIKNAFTSVLTANNIQANSISFPPAQGSSAPTYIDKDKVKTPKVIAQTADITNATVSGNASIASLTATTAVVSGNETVQGTLGVTGKITGNNGLEIAAGQTTLKNTQVNGTLDVTGKTTLKDTQVQGTLDAATAQISGNETVKGTLDVTGKTTLKDTQVQGTLDLNHITTAGTATIGGTITGNNGLEIVAGQTTLKNTQVNGTLGATTAAISGNETVQGTLGVTGKTTLKNTQVNGTFDAINAAISGNETVQGTLGVTGKITGNNGLEIAAGQTTLKNTQVNGTLDATTAAVQALLTHAATLRGITAIDSLRTALITNPTGQRLLCQWASGNLTLGNLLDQLRLDSSQRPLVQDPSGTHKIAYLDDLVGNILFQFGVYSIGESPAKLPPVNPESPPALNDKALVKVWNDGLPAYMTWDGTAWVYDGPIEKPDDYAWEWVVKHYRDSEQEHFATVFGIYSHEETWSIVDIPLELYRPLAEQNLIDNNAKAWTRFAHNTIPDWLARDTPERITSADTGVNQPGTRPPETDKSGLILNKPPILSDLYGMNSIDGGDEDSEAFNQEHWGCHAWGFIVDGGDETYDPVFRYHIDGGNERFLPFWHNRIYPSLAEQDAV